MALQPLESLPQEPLTIKRALISVSDKKGITAFAKSLSAAGVKIYSTGGTASTLRDANVSVTDISELTGFQECLDGRVKTLHPKVHGAILARTSHQPDLDEILRLGIEPFELVVVNLYPFKETVKSDDVTPAIATENIDIGGPTMIRAAAKNFAHVSILTHPSQYEGFLTELTKDGAISFNSRRTLAKTAFEHTADYDAAISNYFNRIEKIKFPEQFVLSSSKSANLRYGENPHQSASIYGDQKNYIDCFHGKELSYNNYLDIDSALKLMSDFKDDDPTLAIFKHTVSCGVATRPKLKDAYERAFATDKTSPFGGIVITNTVLDLESAQSIDTIFTEIILAPDFEDGVIEFLSEKKNRRLIKILKYPEKENTFQFRSIFGGLLYQEEDRATLLPDGFQIVSKRKPEEDELQDLLFAWKIVKHIKSNGIVYAKDLATSGIGTGQTSRVDSSVIAVRKAMNENISLQNSVIASDAFFPFPDGVIAAAQSGARAVIQPGGSIRDEDVINAANEHNMSMVFTGIRHFKH